MSYFVVVARSFFIYTLIKQGEVNVKMWICKHNFELNIFNVTSYVFIDILPIGTIFYLHWKNFREESKKQYMLEKTQSSDNSMLNNFNNTNNA